MKPVRTGFFRYRNPVPSRKARAFYRCPGLTSVTIPGNVTSMYGYSLNGHWVCEKDSHVIFNYCYVVYNKIDGSFQDCDNLASVYFEGNAPTDIVYVCDCPSDLCVRLYGPFGSPAAQPAGFTVYYNANCSTGFNNLWHGYPTAVFTAPCSITTTTTTTIPAETCTVEFFPRRLSKVMNTVMQLQAFIIRGDENSSFSKATDNRLGAPPV